MRKHSHGQIPEPVFEQILSRLRFREVSNQIKGNPKVADLGCGYKGAFLTRIANKISSGIGYDVSVKNKSLPKNITLKVQDLNNKISNKKNYYDYIVALAILEHVKNPKDFLKKAKRMLKTKGRIIITTPHKRSKTILEFLSLKLGLISNREIEDHKNYFNEKSLRETLKAVGYKIIELRTFEFGLNLICVAKKP